MSSFNALNRDWTIRFDGLLLDELRTAHDIDLADITAESWLKLEMDQATLCKAVCFLCREQLDAAKLDARALAGALTGETAEAALQSLWAAASFFFRPKLWSALQSALSQRKAMEELKPLLAMIETLPAGMREAAMGQLTAKMEAMAGGSSASAEQASAVGLAGTPSTSATNSPVFAVSAPAA